MPQPAVARHSRADLLAGLAFGLVTFLSIFPWASGLGDDTGYFSAWSGNWSLLAVTAGAVGLAFAVTAWFRPVDGRVSAAVYGLLAAGVAAGSFLHSSRPPPLSEVSAMPALALAAAVIAALGALVRLGAVISGPRPLSWRS